MVNRIPYYSIISIDHLILDPYYIYHIISIILFTILHPYYIYNIIRFLVWPSLFQENQRLSRQVLEMRREIREGREGRDADRSEPRRASKVFGKDGIWDGGTTKGRGLNMWYIIWNVMIYIYIHHYIHIYIYIYIYMHIYIYIHT